MNIFMRLKGRSQPENPNPANYDSEPKKTGRFAREAWLTLFIFLTAFLITWAVKSFALQPYVVDGQSMETTLQNNDRLLVDKLPVTIGDLRHHPYTPKRGDVIIFDQDNLPGLIGTKQLIKRVIGLPGEHVVVNNGSITVSNSVHPKGFNPDKSGLYSDTSIADYTMGNVDLTLGPDQLFVCGDNRPNSEDSRAFGPINRSQIVGKLSFRIFPFGKIQHY